MKMVIRNFQRKKNIISSSYEKEIKDQLTLAYLRLEDLFKQAFIEILPDPDNVNMPNFLKTVIKDRYNECLKNINGDNFKSLFNELLPEMSLNRMNNRALRNALAHNRSKVEVENGKILYPKNNGKIMIVNLSEIIKDMENQLSWIQKLRKTIPSYKK